MKIAIAGSMSVAKDMLKIKEELEKFRHIIVIPTNTEKYAEGKIDIENKWEKIELDVLKGYFTEIKNCDALLVINQLKNNISNYIGGNSLIEMAFAYVLDKKIFLLNSIPDLNYRDEIEAMKPIILNGDLSLINNPSSGGRAGQ